MKLYIALILISLMLAACNGGNEDTIKEPWASKPVPEWPQIVFTNNIVFEDTTYRGIGNAFLIDTGKDTLGVSCKHAFLIFKHEELLTIDLGENFVKWEVYSKEDNDKRLVFGEMINRNPQEAVDQFNTLKSRDWLLFEVDSIPEGITPLKIRTKPIQENEIIYCLGWPYKQKSGPPSLVKMQLFRNAGPYYYVNTLTENVDPAGRSGSPVIDSDGYLVGIVSGAEGKLGVIGNVSYLESFIER